jgi:high-affinity iron transporter
MLLTSVLLILQETLEAALLISILVALSVQYGQRVVWLIAGFSVGTAMALVYAENMQTVSEWFDFVGQELINAFLQTAITAVLLPLGWLLGRVSVAGATAQREYLESRLRLFGPLCAIAVALAVTREGSEILVFLQGFLGQSGQVRAVAIGSAIGFGIGLSVGLLLLYAQLPLRGPRSRWVPMVLLALYGGNMMSQATLHLIQADWLQSGAALWNTSNWLPEHGMAGRLLYALVGYESSPSAAQAVSYAIGTLAVLGAMLAGRRNA